MLPATHPILLRVSHRLKRRLDLKRKEGFTLQGFIVRAIERQLDSDEATQGQSNRKETAR
jgi:hypothetical protein